MHLIKLDATRSTNEFLKDLWQNNQAKNSTVVWASDQFGGRGQQGTIWTSQAGKNLTFSILKLFEGLNIRHQFYLNMAVSLSIYTVLQELEVPDIRIKWPNDILSGRDKICGILIENIVKAQNLKAAIIGIGLNVNQEEFKELPNAASLKMKSGKDYDLEILLSQLIRHLESRLRGIESADLDGLKSAYEKILYRIHQVSTFELSDGTVTNGIIKGISSEGQLQVELEESIQSFGLKEIKLLN